MSNKSLKLINFIKYLIDVVPNYINKVEFHQNEISLFCSVKNIEKLSFFLKNHINCKFSQLVDICGVDFLSKELRFQVIYNFLSISYSFRLKIKVNANEFDSIPSINQIYNSSI
jgi:NADH dehydrogenase (ubiquinone) Fe-S protein 3